ncbi:MAG: tRNA pseudouridine(38-40) synthase TruA [Firmicutes bacterium]|nr:tRNA pseudouridine(38-40) synthase TruA [Bacillota bacterium]
MRNIRLLVSYDGTDYHGFQLQENALTIQELLEDALKKVTEESIRVIPAGRTDAGVHARGQVVNFPSTSSIPLERFPKALNSCLPRDIVVQEAKEVAPDFNARRSAKSKLYRYTLDCGPYPNVFWNRFAWHPIYKLDPDLIFQAGQHLLGRHDFTSFRAAGSAVKTSVRNITRLEWDFSQAPLWHLFIEADGFLYKMARAIVGTLVEVGRGRISPADIIKIREGKNRCLAGPTAPARGLTLWEVKY